MGDIVTLRSSVAPHKAGVTGVVSTLEGWDVFASQLVVGFRVQFTPRLSRILLLEVLLYSVALPLANMVLARGRAGFPNCPVRFRESFSVEFLSGGKKLLRPAESFS